MECPYCKDTIPDAASVCKTCRRDLQLVTTLKEQLAQAQSDLETARAEPAADPHPAPRVHAAQPQTPGRTEVVAVLAAAAMFPAVAYHLRAILLLPPKAGTAAVVLSAGAAGLVIGLRHTRRIWLWTLAAILLAVVQVGTFCLAFGGSAHNYYVGQDRGIKIGAAAVDRHAPAKPVNTVGSEPAQIFVRHALRDQYLWLFQAIPSAGWFIILAFFGRTYADRKQAMPRKGIGATLARRVTFQRPEEAAATFQVRLDGYSKIFDSLTHMIIVLLGIVSSYYAIARTTASPPEAATVVQQVAQK